MGYYCINTALALNIERSVKKIPKTSIIEFSYDFNFINFIAFFNKVLRELGK